MSGRDPIRELAGRRELKPRSRVAALPEQSLVLRLVSCCMALSGAGMMSESESAAVRARIARWDIESGR